MDKLEKVFINQKDIAENVLKNIGIDIKNNCGEDKLFDNIIWDIAKVFFRIGLINKRNQIILIYVVENMVGIRFANKLYKIIYDRIEELKWCNPSLYNKYKMNYLQ